MKIAYANFSLLRAVSDEVALTLLPTSSFRRTAAANCIIRADLSRLTRVQDSARGPRPNTRESWKGTDVAGFAAAHEDVVVVFGG
jgi:hypothetical protein